MRPPESSTRCSRSSPGRHVVMVNVEADALVGPLLARRAQARGRRLHAGLRRPARADLRARGVGAAERLRGRVRRQGHQAPARLPRGHARDGVGALRPAARADARASTRRCSARSSTARSRPSRWPRSRTRPVSCRRRAGSASRPAARGELAAQLRPARDGGVLDRSGTLEVVSSLHPDGSPVRGRPALGRLRHDRRRRSLRRGRFAAYGVSTSRDGRVAALWRPSHLVGLELGISVARAALDGRADGRRAGADRRGRVPRQARPERGRDRSTARAASTSTACSARAGASRARAAPDGARARRAARTRRRARRRGSARGRRAGASRAAAAALHAELGSGARRRARSTHLS